MDRDRLLWSLSIVQSVQVVVIYLQKYTEVAPVYRRNVFLPSIGIKIESV